MKIILILYSILSVYGISFAQTIGEQFRHTEVTEPYADRLLIIDFFTTNCSNCIASVPKLNALQSQFGSDIQILLVSSESEERVMNLFAHNAFTQGNTIPVIAEDSVLSQYFKHQTVPHIGWIYRDSVIAITEGEFVSERYIQAILNDHRLQMAKKDDFPTFDFETPLAGRLMDGLSSYSLLQGFREDAEIKYGVDTLASQHAYRHYIVNAPITGAFLYAYQKAYGADISFPFMKASRMIFEGVPSSRFIKPDDGLPMAFWRKAHTICYEAVLPDSLSERQRMVAIMDDLNLKLGLKMRIEERKIPCLVVKKGQPSDHSAAKTGVGWSQRKLSIALMLWDINLPDGLPVVNTVGNSRMIWESTENPLGFIEMLKANGLIVEEEDHITTVLVIGSRY